MAVRTEAMVIPTLADGPDFVRTWSDAGLAIQDPDGNVCGEDIRPAAQAVEWVEVEWPEEGAQ